MPLVEAKWVSPAINAWRAWSDAMPWTSERSSFTSAGLISMMWRRLANPAPASSIAMRT